MQTKPIITVALALATALPAAAQAAPTTPPQSLISRAMQIAKSDNTLILDPHVTNCEPPGIVDRAIAPEVQEVCTIKARVLISPRKP
uniref:Uncharacterized protein n=1 Tax=mine drainage metagenome TaxID=410659 RepID=E6PSH2_9ZZZZ